MTICPECQRTFDPAVLTTSPIRCPFCDTDLAENWQAVARVTNLAEAGFLANDLTSCGIESRIFASESFSAVAGRWSVAYLIQVSSHDAAAARGQICQHLTGHGRALSDDRDRVLTDGEDQPISPVFWRPVALMVLAGMASFVVGQQLGGERARPDRPPRGSSLPAVVGSVGGTLSTELVAGSPHQRLWFNNRQRSWYLETDSDGDGEFERRDRFHANGAPW